MHRLKDIICLEVGSVTIVSSPKYHCCAKLIISIWINNNIKKQQRHQHQQQQQQQDFVFSVKL